MKEDDPNDLPMTGKARWREQLKLLREVRKAAFDHHLAASHNDPNDLPMTVKARCWKEQLKLLRDEVRKAAFDHRALRLESLKAELADCDSIDKEAHTARKDKAKHAKRIINTEGMRKPYRIIKSVMKTAPSGSLSKLFVPVSPKDPKLAARCCS